MPIERAKAIVDTAADDKHDILLSQSPDESFINTMKDTLESAGCICRITNSFNMDVNCTKAGNQSPGPLIAIVIIIMLLLLTSKCQAQQKLQ